MSRCSGTKTIGVLTAGGDCPGLNAALHGVCRAAYQHDMTVLGIAQGYQGLITGDIHPLQAEHGLHIIGGTILGTSREKPFKTQEEAHDFSKDKLEAIKKNYDKFKLDGLVVIGGNGSHTTAQLLSEEGLNLVGIPKTIDNDIVGTDQPIGFHSACTIGTEAIDRVYSTAQSHNRVMVIELMGHKTGWLALYAGIAGSSDVILIPEIPYDMSVIRQYLLKQAQQGKSFSVVVVAEGALSREEADMDKKIRKKYREREMKRSIGHRVGQEIQAETGMETRTTVLGYVQRGGIPSASDRFLATSLGVGAVDLLERGEYGKMVVFENNKISSVELQIPAGKVRSISTDHYMLHTALSLGICLGQ